MSVIFTAHFKLSSAVLVKRINMEKKKKKKKAHAYNTLYGIHIIAHCN